MSKIVVVGSSNTDMVVTSAKMPMPGETVLGNEFNSVQGGKGANQAVAASRAGGDVTFIARVGNDDFGRQAMDGYEKDNINTNCIIIDEMHPTGVALIIVNEITGENSIVVAPGANANLSRQDIRKFEPIIANAEVLLVQLEVPLDTVTEALKIGKENKVTTILNPAPAQYLGDDVLGLVDIITPNETETRILTDVDPAGESGVKKAASILLEKVNKSVLITLGENGVYQISKGENGYFVAAQKVEAIDTTAAGDVFNGYLAAGLAKGLPMKEAIQRSNKAAARSVTRIGAQPSVPWARDL